MNEMKHVLILGASGTFGKALVQRLEHENDCHLTLVSRHASICFQENEHYHVVDCDATKLKDLEEVMTGYDVVYCAISGEALPLAAENIVSAMKKRGLHRLILMGAVGIYNEIPTEMDDEDNVKNNPDQVPNRKAADVVESSGLDYTILRPGYLQDGDKDDFTLTFKGEPAKGFLSTIPSVVEFAVSLIKSEVDYSKQSVSITRDMSNI